MLRELVSAGVVYALLSVPLAAGGEPTAPAAPSLERTQPADGLFTTPAGHPIYNGGAPAAPPAGPQQPPPSGTGQGQPQPHRAATEPKPGTARPTTVITVQIQSDFAWFDQTEASRRAVGPIPDGAFFRRARIGAFGEFYDVVEYRTDFEFASPARPRFLDNWVALTDLPYRSNVVVGHFFEPFTLERNTPNRFITFMERSLADTFAPIRNMGLMTYGHAPDRRATWAVGAFRSMSNDYGEDVSFAPGWAVTGRATGLPWFTEVSLYERYLLHVGVAYSFRLPGDDPVRFAALPSVRLSQQGVGGVPVFVDTGPLDARHNHLVGLESALVHGPFSVQGEWITAPVRRRDGAALNFHGGYVYASWFLTGESRAYSPTPAPGRTSGGVFQRVVPKTWVFSLDPSVARRGPGAWELAARWGYIDLNHGPVRGGFLHDVTLGVNWYLNPHAKVQLNLVRAFLDRDNSGVSATDSLALRFQWEH
jgi:phosphate-selective porin OprO/OprP